MSGEFEEIFSIVENALVHREGRHQGGSLVSPDACVACRGGRRPEVMGKISTDLLLRGIDLDSFAWKINRTCPGLGAYVSGGVLLVPNCAISMVVLADLASGARRCA